MNSASPKIIYSRKVDPETWDGAPETGAARAIWRALGLRLEEWRSNWRSMITSPATPPHQPVAQFAAMSDAAIFEAFAIAAISGNARWDRIAAVRDQLAEPFQNFSPRRYAAIDDREIDERLVPWFRERRAGSPRLRAVLAQLRKTATILGCDPARSSQALLKEAFAAAGESPEEMAMLLGTATAFKLPGFGPALAAEALRLLGCDLCKPDRHVLRAIASWKIVRFRRSPTGSFSAPQTKPTELLATMLAVRKLAGENDVGVSYATSVIWLAGAVSGARLTNSQLAQLVAG